MINKILYVHGWGYRPDVWKPLCMAGMPAGDKIDFGYYETPCKLYQPVDYDMIIAHSLGGLWVLSQLPLNWQGCLVLLAGFASFAAAGPRNKTALAHMYRQFPNQPDKVMQNFFDQCGDILPDRRINKQNLYEGLDFLRQTDMRVKLQNLSCRLLTIHSADDQIIPIPLRLNKGDDYHLACGGHSFLKSRSYDCARIINDWSASV